MKPLVYIAPLNGSILKPYVDIEHQRMGLRAVYIGYSFRYDL